MPFVEGKRQKLKGKGRGMGNDLAERLLDFAVQIVKLTGTLPNSIAGRRMGDQLLRSGTSVGANYEESQAAESRNDFIHKLQISLKEIRETNYWLRLITKTKIIEQDRLANIMDESTQLRAILSKAVVTAKKNNQ
jgi:four helix bundle protein